MDLNLKDKRAMVCGSTQGIGKAAAIELANLGAHITLVARNEESLQKTKEDLPNNAQHEYVIADFVQPQELSSKVKEYVAQKNIHILINNTGGPPGGPIFDAKTEEFVQAFSNHLLCNHLLVQAVLDGMKKDNYGRIINIISTSVKQPLKGLGVSNTIRGAVASWAKTLAGEVGQFGITVNNILPGATSTARLDSIIENKAKKAKKTTEEVTKEMQAQIPLGRFASPEETAAVIAFLASPAAAYVHGCSIPVDGGRILGL